MQEIAVNKNEIISDCTRFLPTSHSILQSFHVNLISTMQEFSPLNVLSSSSSFFFVSFSRKYAQIIIAKDLINNHFNTQSTQNFPRNYMLLT